MGNHGMRKNERKKERKNSKRKKDKTAKVPGDGEDSAEGRDMYGP